MAKRTCFISIFLSFLLGCGLTTLLFFLCIIPRKPNPSPIEVIKEKVDTFIICRVDTLLKPIEIERRVVDTIIAYTPQGEISLPREQKTYEGDNFKAIVSGYEPSLDEMYVFNTEKVITRDRYIAPPKLNIGLEAQTIINSVPSINLGIGMDYNVGKMRYGASMGYDFVHNSPYIMANARLNLYSH